LADCNAAIQLDVDYLIQTVTFTFTLNSPFTASQAIHSAVAVSLIRPAQHTFVFVARCTRCSSRSPFVKCCCDRRRRAPAGCQSTKTRISPWPSGRDLTVTSTGVLFAASLLQE